MGFPQPPAGAPVSSVFGRTGAITAVAADYEGVVPAALTGATATTRYVGATASGAPASGTFAVGDFIIDQTGKVYVCTVAGTPGTWVNAGAGAVTSVFSRTGAVAAASNDYTFAQINTANAAIALAKLVDPTTGFVIGSSAGAAAAVRPPGYEWDYVEQGGGTPGNVSITATTAGTANTVVDGTAITYDGAAVIVEIGCPAIRTPAVLNASLNLELYMDSAAQGRMFTIDAVVAVSDNDGGVCVHRRLTPSAGSHTFSFRAWVSSGTGTVVSGAGGSGTFFPSYIRVTKA